MATLKEVREAIKTTLDDNLPDLSGYKTVEAVLPPGWVLKLKDGDFENSFGRGGHIVWDFDLIVLVARTDDAMGQEVLDEIVDPSGSMSIRSVLFDHSDVGLDDGTHVQVVGVDQYGGQFRAHQIPHIGAVLHLRVITPGS